MPYIKLQITREGASAEQKAALHDGRVLTHPVVIGELACGMWKNRTDGLSLLQEWPSAPVATDAAAQRFSARHGLIGRGIGYLRRAPAGSGGLGRRCAAVDARQTHCGRGR